MKRTFAQLAVCLLVFSGCQPGDALDESYTLAEEQQLALDSADVNGDGKPDTGVDLKNGLFVKTADAKLKVADVDQATTRIQQSVARFGGYISNQQLTSNVHHTETVPVSPDSSLLLTEYQKQNVLTLKVPQQHLDSVLKDLHALVIFQNHYNLSADEVSLQLFEQQLAQKRTAEYVERVTDKLDTKAHKIADATQAEEKRLQKQQQSDQAAISQKSLVRQINYSSITLHLYQHTAVERELIANLEYSKYIKPYEPPFYQKLFDSLATGWQIFEWLILQLTKLWGLVLLAAIMVFAYQAYFRRRGPVVLPEQK